MPARSIGVFAYGTSPLRHMTPEHIRAMLAEAALRSVDLHFFSTPDCDPAAGSIEAERYIGGAWQRTNTGLPPVVLAITDPVRPAHIEAAAWLERNTRLVVQRGPDKLQLARLMEASPLSRYVIPYALLAADGLAHQISAWASERGAAVIKPVDGMRGGGIQIIRADGDRWTLSRPGEAHAGSLGEVAGLAGQAIAGRMGYRQYIIQALIDSSAGGVAATAIRLDLHKAAHGIWQMTRETGRIGAFGKLTTNVASGGAQMMIEPFLAARPSRPPADIRREAVDLAFAVAGLIDAAPSFPISELGVDIILDPDDRLWLIEANSYPMCTWAEHGRAVAVIDYALSLIPSA